MKKPFKDILVTVISLLLIWGIMAVVVFQTKTDLEIHTKEETYYVKGLRVTTKVSGQTFDFLRKKDLKKFISDVTSENITLKTN